MTRSKRPRPPRKPRTTPDGIWMTDGRLKLGLCIDEVAALLGENQGRIPEWELGQKPIPPHIKQALQQHGWP